VRYFAGGSSVLPIEPDQVSQLIADGDLTRLGDAMQTAIAYARAEGAAPRRLLLVSDGIDHGAEPAATAAALGIPVDVLPVGFAGAASSLFTLAEVQTSPRVLVGSETRFLAIVRSAPTAGSRTVTVHLAEDGRDVGSAVVELPAGRSEARAELAHRPQSAGPKRYTLRLGGADAATQEFAVNVNVLERTYEVLILEDTWRWEFKYLRRALEDDPSFRFTAILARGLATVMQFGSPDRRAALVGPPQNAADLAPFDLFMLGDVNPARWPRGLAAEIARAVKVEGKSLVVVAGPNLGKIAEQPELHSLLPVQLAPESGTPTDVEVAVRSADETASRFLLDPAAGSRPALPPLERIYAPLRKRPGARVILEAAELANPYGPLVVMAEQTVGRGRVLFVGTDALWQWQTLAPDDGNVTPHRAFWQRALRALAQPRPAGDGSVWLLPEKTRGEAGNPVALWAEAHGQAGAGSLSMSAILPDETRTPLAAVADPAQPGRWRSTLTPPKPGTYRLLASVMVDGQPAGETSTLLEVTSSSESADAAPEPQTLARIAQASGGGVVDLTNPESWPVAEPVAVSRQFTVELWGDGWLLVLLVAVLGLDWLLRLLRGYV
jgi:hypothetical protein